MNHKELIEHNEQEWTIVDWEESKDSLLLHVHYPNCPHGHKYMMFEGITLEELFQHIDKNDGRLNPHFEDSKFSPTMRFNPNARSWDRIVKIFMGGAK